MNWLKKIFLFDKPVLIRVWQLTAILAVLYYIIKSEFNLAFHQSNELDLITLAYGAGSLAILLMIYGFDWD
ncbi:MAG TPA: hypothetical protein DDY13_20130 [Cytophagales bacterium]|jgi:hypothetical protein|nr:hypothetical protein [Cytophagales bacterium]